VIFQDRACPSGPLPLRMTPRSWWHPLPKQRHLELCALKPLAIRPEPACILLRGATPSNPLQRKPSETPPPRGSGLVFRLFSSLAREAASVVDARPDRCAQPCPEDRSGRLWEPSLVSRLPDLLPHTAHPEPATYKHDPKAMPEKYRCWVPDFYGNVTDQGRNPNRPRDR